MADELFDKEAAKSLAEFQTEVSNAFFEIAQKYGFTYGSHGTTHPEIVWNTTYASHGSRMPMSVSIASSPKVFRPRPKDKTTD